METTDYSNMTDEQLILEKKKLDKSKLYHAAGIGFLAGILIFGFGAWILSPEKQLGFLIPMAFPIFFIYKLVKNPKTNTELEDMLNKRGLK